MKFEYKIRSIICKGCEKTQTKRMPKGRNYCSLDCYRKSKRPQRKTGEIIKCGICGIDCYKRKAYLKEKNFCSIKCLNEYQGRNKVKYNCKICSKEFRWSASRITQTNPTYCSTECRNKDKEHLHKIAIKGNLAQQNKNGLNKLELAGNKILNDLGIIYTTQIPMFNKFVVDVLVEDKKLVIQWDGVYWHTKPKRAVLDKSQDAYLKKCGYNVLRITDEQIKNRLQLVYENIKKAIQ